MTLGSDKHLGRWARGYARHLIERALHRPPGGLRHLMFAFCDHFEPLWNGVSKAVGRARVDAWVHRYPEMAADFRDADGFYPRHSFFFPGEQYDAYALDGLARLAERGLGEVELHLHHDGDRASSLRRQINGYVDAYAAHGHLSRDAAGRRRYGFIHGNWSLANARADGRWCGVDEELAVLFETGCYADFTFPSAPDPTQPNIVNQIYWPIGDLARARAHEAGERARVGHVMRDRILMVEGPLALTRRARSVRPRLENGAVTANDPPTPERIRAWVAQNIHVKGRPDWTFVKVHTHGAPEAQAAALLGDAGRALHAELARRFNDGRIYKLHYVTARELFNIAIAAMEGASGDPTAYRDYALPAPPLLS